MESLAKFRYIWWQKRDIHRWNSKIYSFEFLIETYISKVNKKFRPVEKPLRSDDSDDDGDLTEEQRGKLLKNGGGGFLKFFGLRVWGLNFCNYSSSSRVREEAQSPLQRRHSSEEARRPHGWGWVNPRDFIYPPLSLLIWMVKVELIWITMVFSIFFKIDSCF